MQTLTYLYECAESNVSDRSALTVTTTQQQQTVHISLFSGLFNLVLKEETQDKFGQRAFL